MKAFSDGSAMWRMFGLLREYVGVCAGSRSVGRPWKRWIDTSRDCLRKRGLDFRQARRMMQGRCEWWGFVKANAWGVARGMKY